jgi:acyl carrier protein
METIERELLGVLNEVLRHKRRGELAVVEGDPHLREDLKLDSLDLAELTVRIEERFGIDVFEAGVVSRYGEIESRVIQHVRSGKQR